MINRFIDRIKSIIPDNSDASSKKALLAKLCCVLFAVALWLVVVGQNTDVQHEMTYYGVPVTISNATQLSENSGLSIISGYDYNINITVRGNRAKLSNYSSEDITATVDVGSITEAGEYAMSVVVSCPPSSGFTVISQSLDSVNVSVDKLTSVEFDVNVNITNAQYNTDAYALGTPSVKPNKVTVKGPQKVLQSIKGAYVNIDLGNVSSNIGFNNRIVLLDSNGEEIDSPYISLSNKYAEGTVPFISIEEATRIVEKSVPLVYSFKHGYYNNTNCKVELSPKFVTISGYENDLNKIQSINVVTIDETKTSSNTVFSTSINVPEGTTLVDSKKHVTVSVLIDSAVSSAEFEINDVTFENLDEAFSAKLSVVSLLTFRGDNDMLGSMKTALEADEKVFTVVVDMSLVSEVGEFKLPATVKITDSRFKGVWCEYSELYIEVEKIS